MTYPLDTTGAVAMGSEHGARFAGVNTVWTDLDAFTQGYIEAMPWEALLGETYRLGCNRAQGDAPGFSDLAPETLARIIADCADFVDCQPGPQRKAKCEADPETGRYFWRWREAGNIPRHAPLTVRLGDDGKVRFA
ncbi:hypothetical protein [Brevundimonas nasdae]|uniref:hypothetical protein n=1 Tax=Brevundimonas nasdae TaxID=172043 RepID=UPI00289C16E1|nr:hypothetical protein [Brevundimonas nasdae]